MNFQLGTAGRRRTDHRQASASAGHRSVSLEGCDRLRGSDRPLLGIGRLRQAARLRQASAGHRSVSLEANSFRKAVVIGGGVGGLVAAAKLAKEGAFGTVTLLEQGPQVRPGAPGCGAVAPSVLDCRVRAMAEWNSRPFPAGLSWQGCD